MTIVKAIELLRADLLRPGSVKGIAFQDAEQLGIEALKRVKGDRDSDSNPYFLGLIGEDKE